MKPFSQQYKECKARGKKQRRKWQMNIFILDRNVQLCAQYHNNKHLNKMIVEHVQILSTASRLLGLDQGYKLTHKNHPCVKWVLESSENWSWLVSLTYSLHLEWKIRFNHNTDHKSIQVLRKMNPPEYENKGLTTFALAMPAHCKTSDPVESYRNYYMQEKRHLANWGNRGVPNWYK